MSVFARNTVDGITYLNPLHEICIPRFGRIPDGDL